MRMLNTVILFGYVLFASFFFGIITHELIHVIQFGGHVYSIGVVWGANDVSLPLPAFFTQATSEIQVNMSDLEIQAYAIQFVSTIIYGLIGGYFLAKRK